MRAASGQPMGFYSPHTLVADAAGTAWRCCAAGTSRRPTCWRARNAWAAAAGGEPQLVPTPSGTGPAVPAGVRTGTGGVPSPSGSGSRSVRSVGEDVAQRVVDERRAHGPFTDLRQLVRRVQLSTTQLEALATAGALDSLGVTRRRGAVGCRGAR